MVKFQRKDKSELQGKPKTKAAKKPPNVASHGLSEASPPPQVTPDIQRSAQSTHNSQIETSKQDTEGSISQEVADERKPPAMNERGLITVPQLVQAEELKHYIWSHFTMIVDDFEWIQFKDMMDEELKINSWLDIMMFLDKEPHVLVSELGDTRFHAIMKFLVDLTIVLDFIIQMKKSNKTFWSWEEYLRMKNEHFLVIMNGYQEALSGAMTAQGTSLLLGSFKSWYSDHEKDESVTSLRSRFSTTKHNHNRPDPPASAQSLLVNVHSTIVPPIEVNTGNDLQDECSMISNSIASLSPQSHSSLRSGHSRNTNRTRGLRNSVQHSHGTPTKSHKYSDFVPGGHPQDDPSPWSPRRLQPKPVVRAKLNDKVQWDGLRNSFTKFEKLIDGHLMQVGARYITDKDFHVKYKQQGIAYCMTAEFDSKFSVPFVQTKWDRG